MLIFSLGFLFPRTGQRRVIVPRRVLSSPFASVPLSSSWTSARVSNGDNSAHPASGCNTPPVSGTPPPAGPEGSYGKSGFLSFVITFVIAPCFFSSVSGRRGRSVTS